MLMYLVYWSFSSADNLRNFCASGFFFLCAVFAITAKLALAAVIFSKVWIAFVRFVVKSIRPVMALVVFLESIERLIMTVLEGSITNDQFLACSSVSTATSWRTKAFWDWRTFLDFQTRQGCLNSRELAFSTGKGKDNKDKTRNDTADHLTRVFLNEEKWLVVNDSQVLSVLRPTVLPVENDLLLITSAKRMELNRTNNSSSLTF